MKLLYEQVFPIAVSEYSSGGLKTTVSKENIRQLSVNTRRHTAYVVEVFYQSLTHVMRCSGEGALFQLFFSTIEEDVILHNIV